MTEIRYSLNDALESVPKKDFQRVKKDVMRLLNITSRQQLLLYQNGTATPKLSKAKAVEEYFQKNYGITEVWREVQPTN